MSIRHYAAHTSIVLLMLSMCDNAMLRDVHPRVVARRSRYAPMAHDEPFSSQPSLPSRKERFLAGYFWFILKNLIGWVLILLALVAGPLVPGPGGIPLFLIGFALVSFPGKRKLTARVLRGRPIRFQRRPILLAIAVFSLASPVLALWQLGSYIPWLHGHRWQNPLVVATVYFLLALASGLLACGVLLTVNLLLRVMPPIRRRVRPWLRHHRIRLLPPRRRRRLPHEHGVGPLWLKEEILSILKRTHHLKDRGE